jgi:DNA polymerase I-like protein with 3'-5' exonuclease and polymerase domains
MDEVYFDVETTTKNTGHVFTPENKLVSYSLVELPGSKNVCFCYYTDPGFLQPIRKAVSRPVVVVGFNLKFDLHWLNRSSVRLHPECKIWDCSLAEFVISGQQARFESLNDSLASYGLPLKHDLVKDFWDAGVDTPDIPYPVLEEYNNYDVTGLIALKEYQMGLMSPEQINLVYLMGDDLKALVHIEASGVKFNPEKTVELINQIDAEKASFDALLATFLPEEFKHYPIYFNVNSGDHLSCLLYGGNLSYEYSIQVPKVNGDGTKSKRVAVEIPFKRLFTPLEGTEIKKTIKNPQEGFHVYQTGAEVLGQLHSRDKKAMEVLKLIQNLAKRIKTQEMAQSLLDKTSSMGWQDNLLHSQYNQNVAITGRLSSSAPNGQNFNSDLDSLLESRYD